MIFIAIAANADTTYVCDDVGDWDQWKVPTADQQTIVSAGWSMEVTVTDKGSTCRAMNVNDPQHDWWNICKGNNCYDVCEDPDDYPPYGTCPCNYCACEPDGTSVMVQDVISLLMQQ